MDISIVIPVLNEAGNIPVLSQRISDVLIHYNYEIIFVDDGSSDDTLENVKSLHTENPNIKAVSFSRNFGKNAAEICGLQYAQGKHIVLMDGDMQHPVSCILDMMKRAKEGYQIIFGLRKKYKLPFLKKLASSFYAKLFRTFSDTEYNPASSDFLMMERKVAHEVLRLSEYERFNRGLYQWVGFKKGYVEFEIEDRHSGKTSWSPKSLFSLALNGLTSFSGKPLRMSIYMGIVFGMLAFIYIIYAIVQALTGQSVSGWASLLITNLIIGSLLSLQIGIVGEYLFKTFMEVKQRPHYIVNEKVGIDQEK